MGRVLKPQFEQYLHELRSVKPLGAKEVGNYRSAIMAFLEEMPEILVNKASVTGHPEMKLDFKCSWLGPAWNQEEVVEALASQFPGGLFPSEAKESHLLEHEDEVAILRFAVKLADGYLAGRIRVLPS
jgi:hypothetical protein